MSHAVGEVASATVFGVGYLIHVCRTRCHGVLSLPKCLPAKPVREAWSEAGKDGWEIAPVTESTWSTDQDREYHELRRPGVTNTRSDCEAEMN